MALYSHAGSFAWLCKLLSCLSYIPAVTVAPGWFDKRRGLAMGIILGSTGVGRVVWAPLLHALNACVRFRNILRVTGALSFLMIAGAGSMLKWDPETARQNQLKFRTGPESNRVRVPLMDWQVARSRPFIAQATGTIFQAAAYYTPFYFLSSYARTLGYSSAAGANLIAISNGSSACGKFVLGYLGDRLGRFNVLLFCTLLSGASAFGFWFPSTSAAGAGAAKALSTEFAITYSVFAGAYVSLFPTVLAELFGPQNFTSVNGSLYMFRGIGILIGTPVAGSLIRAGSGTSSSSVANLDSGEYERTSVMVGTLVLLATLAVLWGRIEAGGSRIGSGRYDLAK